MTVNFGVNYLAVIVATIAVMVIGFVWFRPQVFGSRWMAYIGKPGQQMRPGPDFVIAIAAGFVNAWTLALFSLNLGGSTIADGVALGVLVWLGFFATTFAATNVFAKRSWGLFGIDAGHALVGQVVMGAIVTVWR